MKKLLSNHTYWVCVLVSLLSPGACFAWNRSEMPEDKGRLAVLPFVIEGLSSAQNRQLQQQFELRLRESPRFEVLAENVMNNVLSDAGVTRTDSCTSLPCLAQLGKVMNVEKVLHVQGMHAGKRYAIQIRLVSASDAKLLYSESITFSGDFNDLLTTVPTDHARKIDNTSLSTETPWYYYAAAVLVGGGVIYLLFSTWATSGSSDSSNPSSTTSTQ